MIFPINKLCTPHEAPFLVEQTLIISISGCLYSNIKNTCDSIITNVAEGLNDFSLIHSHVEDYPLLGPYYLFSSPLSRGCGPLCENSWIILTQGCFVQSLIRCFDRKVKATDNNTYKYLTNFDQKKAPLSLQVQMCKFKLWSYSNDH